MNDPFAKVRIGDPVVFRAQTWNAMLDAARDHQQQGDAALHKPITTTRSSTIIRIKNETGEDLPRGSVLGLSGPIFTPADSDLDTFWREVCFRGVRPDITQHKRRYAITLQGAWGDVGSGLGYGYDSGGQIVSSCISGVCPVKIDVQDSAHEYASIIDTETDHLISSTSGHAMILWSESQGPFGIEPGLGYGYDTGIQWAIVMLGAPTQGNLLWCHGAFAAASGTWPSLTPSHADLDIYQNVHGDLSKIDEAARVYWWFPDSSGSNKIIAVIPNGDGTYDAVNASCTGV